MAGRVTAASKLAESRKAAAAKSRRRRKPEAEAADDDFDGEDEAKPKTRQRKSTGKTRTRTRTRKSKPAEGPFVVDYEYVGTTVNKVRYDALEDTEHYGADRQYLSKEALGCKDDGEGAPNSIKVTFELE